MTEEVVDVDLKEKLKEVFGYNEFRGNQEKIIRSVLHGQNAFVIMPTGAGKSLCYQLPAIISKGTAIVISPLIALMKNQVDQMNAFGIQARFLNSTLSKTEINRVKREVIDGEVKLLYVAPESLTKDDYIHFLKQVTISFVAIDEAHCISEWGHDFRPEYRRIKNIVEQIGNLTLIALTATATPKVQLDIQKNLNMEDAQVFKSSFNRPNLFYEVRPKQNPKKQVIKYIKDREGKSGIVYCLSRKKVEEIAELLCVNGINAAPYHAGLESQIRMTNQDAFLNEDVDVIVATIAFGMGIDKPDVRFVIHYDAPKSLEGYYQETGRGGRDGLEGDCMMLYSYGDILKLEKFNKDKSVTERDNARTLLDEVIAYTESSVCRRKQLLHYFGEHFNDTRCEESGMCDNCRNPKEKFEGKEYVYHVIQAVMQTEERFGITHLANVIKGSQNQYVKSYNHDQLPIFGICKDEPIEFLSSVIRQTLLHEFVKRDIESVGVLKLTDKGKEYNSSPYSVTLSADHKFEDNLDEEGESERDSKKMRGYDKTLFDELKVLRKKVAQSKNLPPYVIFQDPSLEEMATVYPTTKEELSQVNGVGLGKVNKFGLPFVEHIKAYVEQNNITTLNDVIVKSTVDKSKMKIFIIQQVDKKIDFEEIAGSKNITVNELLEEVEHICYSGTKLNLDYYIDQILDSDKQAEICDYFLSTDSDDIDDAREEFDNEYSEEELRLMRIKFLSEYAN